MNSDARAAEAAQALERTDAIAAWAAARYGLPDPVTCALLRAYTNDVYHVASTEARFVLKVYGRDWRTVEEVRYEVALLRHLDAKGAPVALPRAARDGGFVQEMPTPEGNRIAVLFAAAPGRKPEPPFTPALYEAMGRAVARMHASSNDFATEHRRRALDLDLLVQEPLALIAPLLPNRRDRDFLAAVAHRLHGRIAELAPDLDRGPIHGDATLDNLHVTPEGVVILYDFDSGGPGWRAADLQGWAAADPAHRARWEAFLSGYRQVREPSAADLKAAPLLTVAWDLWGMKIDLQNRVLRQGEQKVESYLAERLAGLRRREAELLAP